MGRRRKNDKVSSYYCPKEGKSLKLIATISQKKCFHLIILELLNAASETVSVKNRKGSGEIEACAADSDVELVIAEKYPKSYRPVYNFCFLDYTKAFD